MRTPIQCAAGRPGRTWPPPLLTAATVVEIVMLLRRDDTRLALVLVWALIGIAVAQGDRSTLIAVAAGVGCAALLVAAVGTRAARRTSTT